MQLLSSDEAPNNAIRQGDQCFQIGDFAGAARWFARARSAHPEHPGLLADELICALHAGQLDRSEELAHGLFQLEPDSPQAHFLQGVIHVRRGRETRAAESFRKALVADPADAGTLLQLGIFENRQGRYRAAQDLLERALALEPGEPAILYNLFRTLQAAGDPGANEVLNEFEAARRNRPGSGMGNMGDPHRIIGKYAQPGRNRPDLALP